MSTHTNTWKRSTVSFNTALPSMKKILIMLLFYFCHCANAEQMRNGQAARSAGAERNRLLSRLNPFWLLSLICILVTFPIARRISEQKPTVCSRWKSLLFSNWWHRWRFRLRTVFNGFYRERKRRSKHSYMEIRCQKNFVKVNFWKRTFLIKIKVWNSQFDVLKRYSISEIVWAIIPLQHRLLTVLNVGQILK